MSAVDARCTEASSDAARPGLLTRIDPPDRVAVVRASRIGDFCCATPAFRALRRALPHAEITLIALPWAHELVARSADLDRFEPFPGWPGIAEQWFDARRTARFFADMHERRFDLAIQMHGSGAYANPFTLMLGARRTAGYVRAHGPAGPLDAAMPLPEDGHEVDRVLALTTFLGAPPQGRATSFPLWPDDAAAAAALLDDAEPPLVAIHPAATDASRRWRPEGLAAAARALHERMGGTVVLVGGDGERPLAELVAEQTRVPTRNLAGWTSLPVLGAVLERARVLLTTDSGPAHIAYALRVPTVTIFADSDPARWAAPLARAEHVRVMRPRTAEEVVAAAERALRARSAQAEV